MSKFVIMGKRAITVSLTGTMILWSLGLASLAPAQAATLVAGDLIKASGPAVYYYTSDGKRAPFPNEKVFNSWYVGFGKVKTITDAELAALSLSGTNMTYRPGTRLAKITTDPKVYAVEPGGSLRWVKDEATAKALYGDTWNKQIDDVADVFFTNYSKGADVDSAKPTVGSLVKSASSADIYYVDADGGKRKLADLATFDANGFQSKYVRTVSDAVLTGLTASAKGELKAKEDAVAMPQLAAPSAKAGEAAKVEAPAGKQMLTVALASDNPTGAVHASGTSYNKVLSLNLTAGADADVSLTSLTLTRGGLATDTSLSGVAVFAHTANMRHGTFATFSNNKATVSMSNEPIKVAKGTTVPLWVKVNVTAAAAGQSGTYSLAVNAATDLGTSAEVSGTFPFTSSTFSLTSGANVVGTLTVDTITVHDNGATDATVVNLNMGSNDQPTGKFRFVAGANEDMKLVSIRLYNNGNTVDDDLKNVDLVGPDAAILATAEKQKDKYITFDLSKLSGGGYSIPKGASRDLGIQEDIVSGSARTIRWLLQNDYDLEAYGTSSGAGILATLVGGTTPSGNDQAFPVGDRVGANFVNKITVAAGTMTLSKSASSPTGNIPAGGTLVTLGKFEAKASGEDMELRQISYRVDRSPANATSSLTGTFTVKLQESGATSSPTTIFTVAGSAATYEAATTATLTTYPTLKSNKTYYITYEGDIGSSVPSGTTYSTRLDILQVYRKNSNDTVDPTVAESTANTLTVTTGTLSVAANSSQTPITVVQNQSALATLGSWTFTAGPAEPILVNSVTVDDNTAGIGRNFKELELWVGGAKKSQDTSSTIAPTATTATVAFNLSPAVEIGAGQTAVIEVKGKVLTTTLDASVTFQLNASAISGSGKTSLTSLSTVPPVVTAAQAVTVAASGTLAVSRDTVTNVRTSQVVAGTTGVTFGAYKFQTSNTESIKIRKVYVSNAGSNTNGLTSIGLYDGGANPIGSIAKSSLGSDTLITGGDEKSVVFDFTGMTGGGYEIPLNTFKVLSLKANTVYAATAGQTAQLVISEVEAEGTGSGTRVYTTLNGADATPAASTLSYAAGDVLSVHDNDDATSPNFAGNANVGVVATSTAAAGTVLTTGGDALIDSNGEFAFRAGDVISKWRTMNTQTIASAGSSSTQNYTAGDLLAIADISAGSSTLSVVTTSRAATADIGANGELVNGYDLDNGDIITRVAGGASEVIDASSANTYNAGDVVVVNDTGDATDDGVYVIGTAVNPGTDLTAASALVNGYTFASGRVTKLPVFSTELGATTSAYAYRQGDVVAIHDQSATTDDGIFVVNAARALGSDITAAGGLITGITLTTSDRISRIGVSQTADNLKRLYPTKMNFAWTAASGGAVLSTGNQVEVGRFTMGADTANAANPDARISVTALNFTKIASATLTNVTLNDVTNNTDIATNVTAGTSNLNFPATVLTAQAFTHGESRTFRILADTGTSAGSQSVQFRFNSGSDTSAGTATWSVSVGQAPSVTTVSGVTWTVLASDVTDVANAQMTAASVASDAITPTLSSVTIADDTASTDSLAPDSTLALTFSEKIDPNSISVDLRYGTASSTGATITAGSTGSVGTANTAASTTVCNGSTDGGHDVLFIQNIACVGLGNSGAVVAGAGVASSTMRAVEASLNSAGTVLTLTLRTAVTLDRSDHAATAKNDLGELLTAVRDTAGNLLAASSWTVTNLDL